MTGDIRTKVQLELDELRNKEQKLFKTLNNKKIVSKIPKKQVSLLEIQLSIMEAYINVLRLRLNTNE